MTPNLPGNGAFRDGRVVPSPCAAFSMRPALPRPQSSARNSPHGPALSYAHPWLPDLGDGTYCNPILYADYSDPDAIRVGNDFYLTASSFNCTPGLPILHSRDLVNWTIIGHALKNLPHSRYARVQPGCGVWAPALRFHAGKFWIFFPTPDEGIYVITAEHPAAKWSEPHLVEAGKGLIDPCPLWDDDGKAYLVHAYARSRSGLSDMLRVRPMASDGSRLLAEGEIVFHDPKRHPTLEGPKLLKKDGWYYILAPAGGVETGWQVVLRSKGIYGPYEDRIVLAQGDTDINGPHQGALLDAPDGGWWFLHFQGAGLYGRIVHLQPACWKNGWPLMGENAEPVRGWKKPVPLPSPKPCAPQTSDEFDDPGLGFQWQWHANHRDNWYSLAARPGWLRLFPQPAAASFSQQPNLLLQKFPARSFSVETALELAPLHRGEEAGLVVAGQTHVALGVRHDGTKNHILLRDNDHQTVLQETTSTALKFRVNVCDGGRLLFGFAEGPSFVTIPQVFHARKGAWIGAKVGLYSLKPAEHGPAGHMDADYLRFS
jgi:beta-xylosidase